MSWLSSVVILLIILKQGLTLTYFNYTDEVLKVIDKVANGTSNAVLNEECVGQLTLFRENLANANNDSYWALQMLDASFKVPSGVLDYNVAWSGRYEQCLKIASEQHDVRGKYCLATLTNSVETVEQSVIQTSALLGIRNTPKEIPHFYKYLKSSSNSQSYQEAFLPAVAFCIPQKCLDYELQSILSAMVTSIPLNVTCQVKEDLGEQLKGDLGAIFTILFFGLFVLLISASTVYDLKSVKDQKKPQKLLIAFSAYTNARKLFKTSKNPSEFSSLNGIRFLSMVWVVYGHSLYASLFGPLVNTLDIFRYLNQRESMIFGNAPLSVDTFFVITGMLVVYSFMKAKRFNIFGFYIHRYIRLTPPLIATVLASAFLTRYLASGPYYPQVHAILSNPCKTNWYTTLTYFNTFVGLWKPTNLQNFCVVQTWYLNVDWQIYLISPVFLLLLPKYPKIGLSIMTCAMVASMGTGFWTTWHFKLSALLTNIHASTADYARYYYYQTYTRASTWFIGGILGYVLAKLKLDNQLITFRMPKWLVITTWTVVLVGLPACIFTGHDTLSEETYHPYSNAFWNTFARPAWALCVAWVIFACAVGYGGIINSILSWPLFQVLARFTYSIYLVHLNVLLIMSYGQKQPGYFSLFDVSMRFWTAFALSFGLSIFLVLAFESPVVALERYFLERGEAKESNVVNSLGIKQPVERA